MLRFIKVSCPPTAPRASFNTSLCYDLSHGICIEMNNIISFNTSLCYGLSVYTLHSLLPLASFNTSLCYGLSLVTVPTGQKAEMFQYIFMLRFIRLPYSWNWNIFHVSIHLYVTVYPLSAWSCTLRFGSFNTSLCYGLSPHEQTPQHVHAVSIHLYVTVYRNKQ